MKDKSLRALLIEDSEDDALLIIRELKKDGYHLEYERVETAAALKKALKEKRWDIILCDYNMPNFSAPSAIAILNESNIDIPIIIVSGTIGEETAVECMRLGAKDYIMKGKYSRLCPAIARELAETEVRKKQKKGEDMLLLIQRAVEGSSDAIGISDPRGRHYYQNKAFTDLLGYTAEELGEAVQQIVFADQDTARHVFETIMNGNSCSKEVEYIRKDGRRLTVLLHADAIKDDTGKIVGLLAINTDITERKRMEQELRTWMNRYEMIVASSGQIAYEYIIPTGHITWGSSIEKVLGYTMDEISGGFVQWQELLHPEDRKATIATLDAAEKACTYWEAQYRMQHKRGDYIWIRDRGFFLPDAKGKTYCQLGMLEDITERKMAEEALRSSESKYRLLYDHMRDGFVYLNMDGTFRECNDAFAEMTGYKLEELRSLTFEDITPEKWRSVDKIAINNLIQRGYSEIGEKEYRRKDGTILPVELRATMMRDDSGKPSGFWAVVRDITERKQAEARLKQSEEKYRLLATNVTDVIFTMDMNLNYTYISPSIFLLIGYNADELMKMKASDIVSPETFRYIVDVFMEELETEKKTDRNLKRSRILEYQNICKDGSKVWAETTLTFLRDENQKAVGLLGVARNITSRKESEMALQESFERLKKSFGVTINVLISALEMRDPYTAGHQYRVANIACAIAREMNLDESVIEGIRMAGSIHDIGKLSIPAEILTKPARLNDLEYSLIKEHPVSGFQMLKGIESPWPLAEIVHQHHERIDGSGYPEKLKGDEILLEARILAVADVVEAMGSHRPYRPSLGIEKALNEIEQNRGILYDETVADACLRLFREKDYQLT